jgi:hypothetical protein
MLDSLQSALFLLIGSRAKVIEKAILTQTFDIGNVEKYMTALGSEHVTFRMKIIALFRALFLSESIIIFYALLAVATIVFRFVLK